MCVCVCFLAFFFVLFFLIKVSLHLIHGMVLLDYRKASGSPHTALILSVLTYTSACYSMGDSSAVFSPPHKAIYKLQSNRQRHIISWK